MFQYLGDLIYWHYSDVTLRRSEQQIEREKFLFYGRLVPFNRRMLVPAAILVHLCIGSVYSWSVFNIPIETELNLAAGTAANTFYIAIGFLGFSAALLGPVLERHGPQPILVFSVTMVFLGHMIAAVGIWTKSIGTIYVGYGFIASIGFGGAYISPVSPLQKWFPDRKGLMSGLAVCGFGGGSMIASKAEDVTISRHGVAITFAILGSVYTAIILVCCLVIRCPPPGYYVESPEERRIQLEQEKFRDYLATMSILHVQGAQVVPTPTTNNLSFQDSETPVYCISSSDFTPPPTFYRTASTHHVDGDGDASTSAAKSTTDEITIVSHASILMNPISVSNKKSITKTESSNKCMDTTQMEVMGDAIDHIKEPSVDDITLVEAIFTRDYLCMYITLATNSVAGLMILSKMADIMQQQFGESQEFAANIVLINSGFNLFGRLFYGALSDYIGQKPIFIISLLCQSIITGCLPTMLHKDAMWPFIASNWVLATFYGGGFGVMPAFLTSMFNSKNIGALHGIILTAWSLVAIVGGLTFTAIFKSQVHRYASEGGKSNPNVYDYNFYIICGFVILGFFIAMGIRTSLRERLMPRQRGEILRISFFNTPIVVGYKTKDQQMQEWFQFLQNRPEHMCSSKTP